MKLIAALFIAVVFSSCSPSLTCKDYSKGKGLSNRNRVLNYTYGPVKMPRL